MARRKQQATGSPPPSESHQTLVDDGVSEPPTRMTTKSANRKRNRPTDVEASKPVSSPTKKKSKAGTRQQLPTTANEETASDAEALVPPPAPRPRPRRKGAAPTENTESDKPVAADTASLPRGKAQKKSQAVEDEKQLLLAAAMEDEDAKAVEDEENAKERTEMARRLFINQTRTTNEGIQSAEDVFREESSYNEDNNGEDGEDSEDDGEDDDEDIPLKVGPVREFRLSQGEILMSCIITFEQPKPKTVKKRGDALRTAVDKMVAGKKGTGANKGSGTGADKGKARPR
jgi:hypothetical protein